MTTTPYPYQLKGVRKLRHFNGRALLADEMGLGKSLQALLYAQEERLRPILIVCPASLKWNWQSEARTHLQMRAEVLEGRRARKLKRSTPAYIINYDIISNWMEELLNLDFEIMIIDEVQAIKNRDAKRTKAIRILAEDIPEIVGLSGTPLTNRPIELFVILNLLRPELYPSYHAFGSRYCKPKLRRWGWEYKGADNLDELHTNLNATMMIRRLKQDVAHELPPKRRHVVPLPIEDRAQYQKAEQDFLTWLRDINKQKAKKAAKAEKLVKTHYLLHLAAQLKMKAVLEWMSNFFEETDGKLVMFAHHHDMIKQMWQRYRNESAVVTGKVVGRKRQYAIDRFQNHSRCRLFLGNKAAAEGINLTAASVQACCEMFWVPGTHMQMEDRIHRIGQAGSTTDHYYLVGHDTIEVDLCAIIQEKQKTLNQVLDGGNGEVLDIYDEFERSLLRRF